MTLIGGEREALSENNDRSRRSDRFAQRFAVAGLGVVLLAGVAACGDTNTPEAADGTVAEVPKTGGKLVVAVPAREPDTVLRLALEPLMTFAADGTVAPLLAESVEPNEAFDQWTIKVRPGISFTNGEPLDAEAVKANLDLYALSETFRTDPFAPIRSTTVVDDLTLEVEMHQPWASFPAALTAEQSDGTGLMAAPESITESGAFFLADPGRDRLYGTGPFLLDGSVVTEDSWVVRRNPDYWQEGLPYLDEIELVTVEANTDRVNGIGDGDVDVAITSGVASPAGDLRSLEPVGEPQVLTIALNTRRAPLDDPNLREALAAATDVESLAQTVGVAPELFATGPFAPGSQWADTEAARHEFDPERAASLVAAHEAEFGPARIKLGAADLELENVALQQQIAQMWTDAGVEVEVSVVDPFTQLATVLVTDDFDAMIGPLFGLPDPDLNYFRWHSSALRTPEKRVGYNYVGIDDDELDAALDAARETTDPATRQQQMVTVQRRIEAAQPYVWLWATRWGAVLSPRVRGLDTVPLPDGGTRLPLVGPRLNYEAAWIELSG